MPSKKAPAATKTAKPAMASGIVIPPAGTSMAEAVRQPDADTAQPGADALLGEAAASAQAGQEPELPPPPPDSGLPIPDQDQAPQPAVVGVDLSAGSDTSAHWRVDAAGNFEGFVNGTIRGPVPAPIHDLADARALPDVGSAVYVRASFDSPLAIRAFKDHDGRSMAVVWTGYNLAKAALND